MPFIISTTFPFGTVNKLLTLVIPSSATTSRSALIKSGENYVSYYKGMHTSEYHRKFHAVSLAMQVRI